MQREADRFTGYAGQEFLPDSLVGRQYYRPAERGFEREIRRRIAYWARLKEERRRKP